MTSRSVADHREHLPDSIPKPPRKIPGQQFLSNPVFDVLGFPDAAHTAHKVAHDVHGPLDRTWREGVVGNDALWNGLGNLEEAAIRAGLKEALADAAEDFGDLYERDGDRRLSAADFIKKHAVPAIDKHPGALGELLAHCIVASTKGAGATGLKKATLVNALVAACSKAGQMLAKGEDPDVGATAARFGKLIATQAIDDLGGERS